MRDLAGYTLGRSDLLRRAMSKKKEDVMQREREAFVNGSVEEGIVGCVSNGIPAVVANKIYDDMLDFAKYAFNKSHAAAYAVVSYQTAYLKYYYPVEFMAALMTSVIDNPTKVSEYIFASKLMGIELSAPDINTGQWGFSVDGDQIRFGLGAIKGIGRGVIDAIVEERKGLGAYKDIQDFITRMTSKEVNKRTLENFIKAGAFDCLEGTRKQLMHIYIQILDDVSKNKKASMAGQMSLFEIVAEEDKKQFEVQLPDVGEFEKKDLLGFEKEVLGVYLSGHPLEEYEEQWRKMISAKSTDFYLQEEGDQEQEAHEHTLQDGAKEIVGGMIVDVRIHYTKNNQTMAFVQLEDLLGVMEVVIFPRDYEANKHLLVEDEKVFIKGKVSKDDVRASTLLCEKIIAFDHKVKSVWVQFESVADFESRVHELNATLAQYKGNDGVSIYCKQEKAVKKLGPSQGILVSDISVGHLMNMYGADCVKVVEKVIEKNF